ncbi:MAG: hypothetical protein E3J72_03830 [Planctomycetota bacterium]|nr:MAG: hypothetical protein E3J72_03830 [Planctomycetota bacterium]
MDHGNEQKSVTDRVGRVDGRRRLVLAVLTGLVAVLFFLPIALQEAETAVISQGDHGRDLYLYDVVAKGGIYLRDFGYIYGPLSLELHGLVFRFFGASIKTALAMRAVLLVLLVIVSYLSYLRYARPVPAAIGALLVASVQLPFWHTFNHIIISIGIVSFIGAAAPWLAGDTKRTPDENTGRGMKLGVLFAALSGFLLLIGKFKTGFSLLIIIGLYLSVRRIIQRNRRRGTGADTSAHLREKRGSGTVETPEGNTGAGMRTAGIFAAFSVFLVLIAKLNIGLSLLFGVGLYLSCARIIEWNRYRRTGTGSFSFLPSRRTLVLFCGALGAAAVLYGCYLVRASGDEVVRSFPYTGAMKQDFGNPFVGYVRNLKFHSAKSLTVDGVRYKFLRGEFVFTAGIFAFIFLIVNGGYSAVNRLRIRFASGFLGLLVVVLVHEWLAGGNIYPLAFYGAPAAVALVVLAIDHAVTLCRVRFDKSGKRIFPAGRFLPPAIVGLVVLANLAHVAKQRYERQIHLLTMPRGGAGVLSPNRGETRGSGGAVSDSRADCVVNPAEAFNRIADFIMKETDSGERVLTLPYTVIHNFLADRPMPTNHLEFMKISVVSPEDERKVTEAMERYPVRLVLLSNEGLYPAVGGVDIGRFPDVCRTIFEYIRENYEVVGVIGEFDRFPGWVGNHGVLVFWRKSDAPEEKERIERYKKELRRPPADWLTRGSYIDAHE